MLIGPHSTAEQREEFRRRILAEPAQLHRAADAGALARAELHRRSDRGAPRRPAAVRAVRRNVHGRAGRPDARGAAPRLARREFVAGRRQQGHLGADGVDACCPESPTALLDEPLPGAGRAHGAAGRRLSGPDARPIVGHGPPADGAVGTASGGIRRRASRRWKTSHRTSGCSSTIEACVAAARENARQVREQISTEMWEQLNRLYLHVRRNRSRVARLGASTCTSRRRRICSRASPTRR